MNVSKHSSNASATSISPSPGTTSAAGKEWPIFSSFGKVVESNEASDPRDTAQEAVHQVMPKADAQKAQASAETSDVAKPPLRAAETEDSRQGQPQPEATASVDQIRGYFAKNQPQATSSVDQIRDYFAPPKS